MWKTSVLPKNLAQRLKELNFQNTCVRTVSRVIKIWLRGPQIRKGHADSQTRQAMGYRLTQTSSSLPAQDSRGRPEASAATVTLKHGAFLCRSQLSKALLAPGPIVSAGPPHPK